MKVYDYISSSTAIVKILNYIISGRQHSVTRCKMSVFDDIIPLEFDEAKILVTQIDQKPHVIFKGIIDNPFPEKFIGPFLEKIHNQLIENNQTILYCNLKNLDFINSSGLKCFVNWILNLKKIDTTKQYQIVLLLNPSESWQKKSFSVISLLYKDHIIIE